MNMNRCILLVALLAFVAPSFALCPVHPTNSVKPSDVQIIVTTKKIWFLTDESPVKHLMVQLQDDKGTVVMEKMFSSKLVDWSLDVHALPAGKYQIFLDSNLKKSFVRKANRP